MKKNILLLFCFFVTNNFLFAQSFIEQSLAGFYEQCPYLLRELLPLEGAVFWETKAAERLYKLGDLIYKEGSPEYVALKNIKNIFTLPGGDFRLTNNLQSADGYRRLLSQLAENFFKNLLNTRKNTDLPYQIGRYSRLAAIWFLLKMNIVKKTLASYLEDIESALNVAYKKQSWKNKIKILQILSDAVALCKDSNQVSEDEWGQIGSILKKTYKEVVKFVSENKKIKETISTGQLCLKGVSDKDNAKVYEKKIFTFLVQRMQSGNIAPLLIFGKETKVTSSRGTVLSIPDCVETFFRNVLNTRFYDEKEGLTGAADRLLDLFPNAQQKLVDYYKRYQFFISDKDFETSKTHRDVQAYADWAQLFCGIPNVEYVKEGCGVRATIQNVLMVANVLLGLGWPELPKNVEGVVAYIQKYLPEFIDFFGTSDFMYDENKGLEQNLTIPIKIRENAIFTINLQTRTGEAPGHIYMSYTQSEKDVELHPNASLTQDDFDRSTVLYFLVSPQYWISQPQNLFSLFAYPIQEVRFVEYVLSNSLRFLPGNWAQYFLDVLKRSDSASGISIEDARLHLYNLLFATDKKLFLKKEFLNEALKLAKSAFNPPDTFEGLYGSAPYLAQELFESVLPKYGQKESLQAIIAGFKSKSTTARDAAESLLESLVTCKNCSLDFSQVFNIARDAFTTVGKESLIALPTAIKIINILRSHECEVDSINQLVDRVEKMGTDKQKFFIKRIQQI